MDYLSEKDIKLLTIMQGGMPICSRPYREIAAQIGDMTEDEVIERIKRLKEQKVIRRIAGLFDADKLGFVSVLCGMKVPAENIDALSDLLQQFSGITHNYLRHHEYNMWFTLISPSKEVMDSVLDQIEDSGLANHMVKLYSEKKYKIRANFAVGDSR